MLTEIGQKYVNTKGDYVPEGVPWSLLANLRSVDRLSCPPKGNIPSHNASNQNRAKF